VSKGSSKGDIKKAFFAAAKKYHPDTNQDPGASEKFKEASEAWEVLGDEDKRAVYDNYGHEGIENSNNGGDPSGNPFGGGFGGGGFQWSSHGGGAQNINVEDLFGELFGRNPNAPRKGPDLQTEIQVSFMDAAVFGIEKDIDLTYQTQDPRTGRVSSESRNVVVNVPAGVDDGMNLRVSGQGGEGSRGGPRGDMFVKVHVQRHPRFERAQNGDIHVKVPINMVTAVLGGVVDVPTVYGDVEMKIPEGATDGTKLLMRGKGAVKLGRGGRGKGGKGDQICHLKVEIPKKISDKAKKLLEEFSDEVYGNKVEAKEGKDDGEVEEGEEGEEGGEEGEEKKGFFSGLFGKKKGNDDTKTKAAEEKA
jgi:molecular chaperone DnaJ